MRREQKRGGGRKERRRNNGSSRRGWLLKRLPRGGGPHLACALGPESWGSGSGITVPDHISSRGRFPCKRKIVKAGMMKESFRKGQGIITHCPPGPGPGHKIVTPHHPLASSHHPLALVREGPRDCYLSPLSEPSL